MRKFMLGTVAVAAGVALALPASADEMMEGISITGTMNQDVAFGKHTGGPAQSADEVHFDTDAELAFTASKTTDGGLTITAVMELDADAGAGVDESNLTVSGGFGSLILGAQDNAANMHGNKGMGNGYGGIGHYDGCTSYTPAKCMSTPANSDHVGVRYSTPNIGGFQAGVSFQPDTGKDTPENATVAATNDSNRIAVGGNFSGDFVGTSVTLGANFVSTDSGSAAGGQSDEDWGIGANFGIGDTTLSLRYDVNGAAVGDDTTGWAVAADHAVGNLTFGIGVGLRQEPTADHTVLAVGASYVLGGGTTVSAAIQSGEVDNDTGADMDDVGVGMRIAFSF